MNSNAITVSAVEKLKERTDDVMSDLEESVNLFVPGKSEGKLCDSHALQCYVDADAMGMIAADTKVQLPVPAFSPVRSRRRAI